MLDAATLGKLSKVCKKMPNILAPDLEPFVDGNKKLFVAPVEICSWAQNLISDTAEHAHLRKAQVLLLIKVDPAVGKKLKNAERVAIGKAQMPSMTGKLLSGAGHDAIHADFVVMLSGDWLQGIGVLDDEFKFDVQDLATMAKAMALIDHELMHCSAKRVGQYIADKDLPLFLKDVGPRHIETCDDIKNEDGDKLVRYYALDKCGHFTWKMRKHDITEFLGVIDRFGKWDRSIARLVDEIKKNEETLFGKVA